MNKYLLTLLLAFLFLPFIASAAYNTLQFPQATTINLVDSDKTFTIDASSNAANMVVYPSYIVFTLEKDGDGNSSVTLTSTQKYDFGNSLNQATTCSDSSSTITLTGPSSTGTRDVTVTPSGFCTSSGGGGGGGGGGASYTPPAQTTTPTPTTPTTPTTPVSQMTQTQLIAEISRIAALIAQLQTQLQQLQGQEGGFTTDLYYGMKGNSDVTRLQQFLIDKGYLTGTATGNYLTKTVAAVKAYQTAKGITPVNGRFGPKTRAAVNADLGF